MHRRFLLAAVLATCAAPSFAPVAFAHVTLEPREARVGSPYRAVLRVPHGCDGAATTAIRVRIPDGMIAVKPMPHAGWTLSTQTAKYAKPVKYYHSDLTEGVVEISWAGGKLPDNWYDEFVFSGSISNDATPDRVLYFPVVQECEGAVTRWIEIPVSGQLEPARPAPGLKLLPASQR